MGLMGFAKEEMQMQKNKAEVKKVLTNLVFSCCTDEDAKGSDFAHKKI
jgi:hypothetical protein